MLLLELGESHGRGEVFLWIHGAQGLEMDLLLLRLS